MDGLPRGGFVYRFDTARAVAVGACGQGRRAAKADGDLLAGFEPAGHHGVFDDWLFARELCGGAGGAGVDSAGTVVLGRFKRRN